jgi:DNA-directed RNA polymerase specialized sigma24 family protein
MRSGRKLPRRAGSPSGPPGPVTRADADLAVAALYYLHYRPLVRLAALLVTDLVTAETIVQDAFVDLYTVWPGLLGDSAAIVYLRRRVVDRSRSAPAGHGPGGPGLPAALWALPARQREVLVLQYFADLPQAQVAAAAGISEAAVRSQVALAFSALRTELPPLS